MEGSNTTPQTNIENEAIKLEKTGKESEVRVSIQELRKRKLFIATPMYGGMCHGGYTNSLIFTKELFLKNGMDFRYFNLTNESLITRARNYCADEFLRSDATHMLFIDSDIEFNPTDILILLAIAGPGTDKDIVCGTYPKKNVSWEKIVEAVNQGFGDENPNNLEHFLSDFVFNPVKSGSFNTGEPLEVLESGTGFMMIQRYVFEKFAQAHPELSYKPDHTRSDSWDGSREITAFFNDPIDPVSKRFLSEDYYFCQEVRKLGMKVWICPWMNLNHWGTYRFIGNMNALAAIQASPTIDPRAIKKDKLVQKPTEKK